MAAVAFFPLALSVPGASPTEVASTGALVVGAAVAMTVLAVAVGAQAADLSHDGRPALGPGTVYLFLAVGGLFNLVLGASGLQLAVGCCCTPPSSPPAGGRAWRTCSICLDGDALAHRPLAGV